MFTNKQNKYSIRKGRGWKTASSVLVASLAIGTATLLPVASVSAHSVAVGANYKITDVGSILKTDYVITQGTHGFDNGIDLAAPKGTPIYAPVDGTVYSVNTDTSSALYNINGNFVSYTMPNGENLYFGHLQHKPKYKKGDKIKKGDIIGYMGDTGHATGTALHLGIRNANETKAGKTDLYALLNISKSTKVGTTIEYEPEIEEFTSSNYYVEPETIYRSNYKLDYGKTNVVQEGQGAWMPGGTVVNRIVEVGLKPVTKTETIPFATEYRDNPNQLEGYTKTIREGVNGSKTTSTYYTLETKTGNVKPTTTVTTNNPKSKIVERGTKKATTTQSSSSSATAKTTSIAASSIYRANDKLDYGITKVIQKGSDGVKDASGKVIKQPVSWITETGTKPTVKTETIPFKTEIVINPNLAEGTTRTKQNGKNGAKVTTTTYKLDTKTGKITVNTPTVKTTPAVNKIVEKGTKKATTSTVRTTPIAYSTVYRANSKLAYGTTKEVQKGVNGTKDASGKVTKQPVNQIIEVGTKPRVVTRNVNYTTVRRNNPNLAAGTEKTVQQGKNGVVSQTTTYKVDSKTGKITTDKVTSKYVTKPVDKIVEVGTKKPAQTGQYTSKIPNNRVTGSVITYTDNNNKKVTITITKNKSANTWSATGVPSGVTFNKNNGSVVIPYGKTAEKPNFLTTYKYN